MKHSNSDPAGGKANSRAKQEPMATKPTRRSLKQVDESENPEDDWIAVQFIGGVRKPKPPNEKVETTRTPATLEQLRDLGERFLKQGGANMLKSGNVFPVIYMGDATDGAEDVLVTEPAILSAGDYFKEQIAKHGYAYALQMIDTCNEIVVNIQTRDHEINLSQEYKRDESGRATSLGEVSDQGSAAVLHLF